MTAVITIRRHARVTAMDEGKTVLISGASSGIGEATALALAARGFRVLAGVRQERDGERLERSATGALTAVRLDITDASSVAEVRKSTEALVGDAGLWGLFNNAGTTLAYPVEFMPLERLRAQFESNVFGHVALTQAMLPMLRRARGRIINNTSVSGKICAPMGGSYSGSKHALEALSDALRQELAGHGVQVSVIEAGAIATPIWSQGLDEMWADFAALDTKAHQLYGTLFNQLHYSGRCRAPDAADVSLVVDAVCHALTAQRARARYVIGSDARLLLALKWLLPDRWLDRALHWLTARDARAFERSGTQLPAPSPRERAKPCTRSNSR